jgi:hypothetical protein
METGAKKDENGNLIANSEFSSSEKLMYQERYKYNMEEEYSIITSFYHHSNEVDFSEEHKNLIEEKSKTNATSSDKVSALKTREANVDVENKNKNIDYETSGYSMQEANKKSSSLVEVKIADIHNKSEEQISIADTFKVFKDKITYKINSRSIYETEAPNRINLSTSYLDTMLKQNDDVDYMIVNESNPNIIETNKESALLKRTDNDIKIKDAVKNMVEDKNVEIVKEKMNLSAIDKTKVYVKNLDKATTRYSNEDSILTIKYDKIKDVNEELLETKDSMEIDTNTNIDKE